MKKSTKEGIKIARHISGFLNDYVPSQKTDSMNTLKAYQYALVLYMIFLEAVKGIQCTNLSGGCFGRTNIEEWLTWLKEVRECSPETCNNRLASIRSFLKYLGSRDASCLYLYQEASEIPRRKCTKKKVKGISRLAVKTLLEVPDPSEKTGRRDLAFMILLYSTAARLDEILSMKNEQLHLDCEKPYATVIGKGNKIRTLYLLPKAVAHLKRYQLEFHGDTPEPKAFLFYSRNIGIYGKLTQPTIAKMLKKHAESAHKVCDEVPLSLHAHHFRHTFCSRCFEANMQPKVVQNIMGHQHYSTTIDIYTHVTEAKFEEEIGKFGNAVEEYGLVEGQEQEVQEMGQVFC